MADISTDILVVGGGAAGLSAALSASAGGTTRVTLVDDNPLLGGQIWRAELGQVKSPEARRLIDSIESGRIEIVNNAQVWGADGTNSLLAETPDGTSRFTFDKLIIATGARERFLPFPGWTLPGVFGAGGLQALVKGGLSVAGKRVVVAGTGPLLLAVAEYLKNKGATIAFVAEQTPAARIRKFAIGLWRTPRKVVQAAFLRSKLISVPYKADCWVTSVECASPRVSKGDISTRLSVKLSSKSKLTEIECDYLACGFHLVPNLELASLLGCEIRDGFVLVDEFQQTTAPNIYCAGEPTGIGGVESSLIEGKIAGLGAAGQTYEARQHFAQRDGGAEFGRRLNDAFQLREELKLLAEPETIVCRCEDVRYANLKPFESWREAKLQTRCGMGACQGRVCGAATEFVFGWRADSVRPPLFPVKLENL